MIRIIFLLFFLVVSSGQAKEFYEILDLKIENGLPFVNLNIEGQNLKLLLDTGARNTELIVDKKFISNFKTLVEFKRKGKSGDVTGKKYIAKHYLLPNLKIGQLHFKKVNLAEDTKWGLKTVGSELKNDGAIGLALFANKSIIIDYPNQKLVIIEGNKIPSQYEIKKWLDIPYKISLYGLHLFVNIDKSMIKKNFILDSGANLSIIKPSSIGNNIISKDCKVKFDLKSECRYVKDSLFKVDDINFNNMSFYLYDFKEPTSDGIIGYNFLYNKQIFIDFEKRKIKINIVKNSSAQVY